jgi:hypothetical protein
VQNRNGPGTPWTESLFDEQICSILSCAGSKGIVELALDLAEVTIATHRGSVGQIIDKGYLHNYLTANPDLQDVIHCDPSTRMLVIEDPKSQFFWLSHKKLAPIRPAHALELLQG